MNPIVAEVVRRGRVTFAEFMELALYHPEAGYYTRERTGPGPAGGGGDFLTAPTASATFAHTIAELIRQLAATVGKPVTFVELGAGEGLFLAGFLDQLGDAGGAAVRRVVAVETAAWARSRIASRCPGVEVTETLAAARWPDGPVVAFASELYDALPVHRITLEPRGDNAALAEFYVEAGDGGTLRWCLGEPSAPVVVDYLAEHGIGLERGQVVEIRPQARPMHAANLRWCGVDAIALILDYGHPGRRLYDPRSRRAGSLVGYRVHKLVDDVLAHPGEIDITAHVNFDDLENGAADAGWDRGVIRPLGSFLTVHGVLSRLPAAVSRGERLTPEQWAKLSEVKRLLSPSGMGTDLKVLAQGRGRTWRAYVELATPPPADA